MPPIWVFIVLFGLPHAHTLATTSLRTDPSVELKTSKSEREFRVWTAPRWEGVADRKTKLCKVRYFALVTGSDPVRLIAENQEQILDTSWTFDYAIGGGERITAQFWFLNPIGGEALAFREKSFTCWKWVRPEPSSWWDTKDEKWTW